MLTKAREDVQHLLERTEFLRKELRSNILKFSPESRDKVKELIDTFCADGLLLLQEIDQQIDGNGITEDVEKE